MKKLLSLFIFSLLVVLPVKTMAISCIKNDYQADVIIKKNEINVGEEEYISVSSKNFLKLEYTFDQEGIVEVSNNGLIKGLSKGEANILVTINFLLNNEIVESCTTSIPIKVSSPINTLKSLNIKEMPLENFSPNVYSYEITLPYKYDVINIEGEASSEGANVSGLGEKKLNVGLNEFKILVSSGEEGGITYTLAIFREEASNDTTLKSLLVEGFIINPSFDPNIHNYMLDVPKDVSSVTVRANANDLKAKVSGTGKQILNTGKNIVTITVLGENGDISNYKIEINKNKGSSALTDLSVTGYKLDKNFQSDIYIYSLNVKNKVKHIDINAKANEDDQIEILSDGNLTVGKNEILIRVTSEDKTTTTYKLIVNRAEKSNIFNSSTFIIILFIIFVVLIIFTTVLIIIFIKRNKKTNVKIKKNRK